MRQTEEEQVIQGSHIVSDTRCPIIRCYDVAQRKQGCGPKTVDTFGDEGDRMVGVANFVPQQANSRLKRPDLRP